MVKCVAWKNYFELFYFYDVFWVYTRKVERTFENLVSNNFSLKSFTLHPIVFDIFEESSFWTDCGISKSPIQHYRKIISRDFSSFSKVLHWGKLIFLIDLRLTTYNSVWTAYLIKTRPLTKFSEALTLLKVSHLS